MASHEVVSRAGTAGDRDAQRRRRFFSVGRLAFLTGNGSRNQGGEPDVETVAGRSGFAPWLRRERGAEVPTSGQESQKQNQDRKIDSAHFLTPLFEYDYRMNISYSGVFRETAPRPKGIGPGPAHHFEQEFSRFRAMQRAGPVISFPLPTTGVRVPSEAWSGWEEHMSQSAWIYHARLAGGPCTDASKEGRKASQRRINLQTVPQPPEGSLTEAIRYRVIGMDCGSCAAKIRKAVRSAGVENLEISTTSQILSLNATLDEECLAAVVSAVADAGYRLEPLPRTTADLPDERKPHSAPEYRRALWIVIGLNVGYGVVEMIGGFLSGSQALKADALDFFGDGLITLLGVLAIGWGMLWRARAALVQGLFLGALGLGVVGDTVWRLFSQQPVEAGLMGIFALLALAVNIGAALILVPHRAGDANVRAVWLFSRNDAIGNAAVVLAALLVAWTGRAWPDLITAIGIAGLFLQSSWVILRDAWQEISRARSGG